MNIDIDECLPGPCQKNGTCTDIVNAYLCDCVAGFNRPNCENIKHFLHTIFVPANVKSQARCFKCFFYVWFDWQKMPCIFNSSDIDECADYPCQNNGTCTDMINDY